MLRNALLLGFVALEFPYSDQIFLQCDGTTTKFVSGVAGSTEQVTDFYRIDGNEIALYDQDAGSWIPCVPEPKDSFSGSYTTCLVTDTEVIWRDKLVLPTKGTETNNNTRIYRNTSRWEDYTSDKRNGVTTAYRTSGSCKVTTDPAAGNRRLF